MTDDVRRAREAVFEALVYLSLEYDWTVDPKTTNRVMDGIAAAGIAVVDAQELEQLRSDATMLAAGVDRLWDVVNSDMRADDMRGWIRRLLMGMESAVERRRVVPDTQEVA